MERDEKGNKGGREKSRRERKEEQRKDEREKERVLTGGRNSGRN